MKAQIENYQGNSLRYSVVSDNGILLNTVDVCSCLDISERLPDSILSQSCMDIVGVIEASLTSGRSNMEFVEWLEKKFIGYEMQTLIRPNCDDDWKLN